MADKIEVWADYAKDRFESASQRIDDFRSSARQLGAVVAVLAGLELTLIGRVLDLRTPVDSVLRTWCLSVLLLAVFVQILLFGRLLFLAYASIPGIVEAHLLGPESPVVLAKYVLGAKAEEVRRMIGAYYAKAHDQFHDRAEKIGRSVAIVTVVFALSLTLPIIGLLMTVRLASTQPPGAPYTGTAMVDSKTPTRSSPPQASTTPQNSPSSAPQLPTTPPAQSNPLLQTPTSGLPVIKSTKDKEHRG